MLGVGDHAVLPLDHRDDVREQDHLEGVRPRCAGARLALAGLLGLCRLLGGIRRDEVDVLALAVVHHHDEGHRLAFGDQVVQDLGSVALGGPADFVLGIAVLQIQDGIALAGIVLVFRGQVDVAAAHALRGLGPVVLLLDGALGHVLDLPEIHVGRGDLDAAAPAAGAEEGDGPGIGQRHAVHVQLVIVEAHVLGT